jgi:hypothetical protein
MAKRRTSAVQRRPRASEQAMTRRAGASGSAGLDWRIVAIAGAVVVALVIVVVALLVSGSDSKFAGTIQPDEGRNHVTVGQVPTYKSVPATSGPHWSSADPACPMNWGVYTSAVLEPCVLHNLEHGGIVIWYQSGLPADQVARLADFVNAQLQGAQFKYILSPWTGKDFGHPVAVTAWRYLLYLDTADTDAVRGFANQHYGKAPEPNGGPAAPA